MVHEEAAARSPAAAAADFAAGRDRGPGGSAGWRRNTRLCAAAVRIVSARRPEREPIAPGSQSVILRNKAGADGRGDHARAIGVSGRGPARRAHFGVPYLPIGAGAGTARRPSGGREALPSRWPVEHTAARLCAGARGSYPRMRSRASARGRRGEGCRLESPARSGSEGRAAERADRARSGGGRPSDEATFRRKRDGGAYGYGVRAVCPPPPGPPDGGDGGGLGVRSGVRPALELGCTVSPPSLRPAAGRAAVAVRGSTTGALGEPTCRDRWNSTSWERGGSRSPSGSAGDDLGRDAPRMGGFSPPRSTLGAIGAKLRTASRLEWVVRISVPVRIDRRGDPVRCRRKALDDRTKTEPRRVTIGVRTGITRRPARGPPVSGAPPERVSATAPRVSRSPARGSRCLARRLGRHQTPFAGRPCGIAVHGWPAAGPGSSRRRPRTTVRGGAPARSGTGRQRTGRSRSPQGVAPVCGTSATR